MYREGFDEIEMPQTSLGSKFSIKNSTSINKKSLNASLTVAVKPNG